MTSPIVVEGLGIVSQPSGGGTGGPILRLLDTDEVTVLFDFNDTTGANNPYDLQTEVQGDGFDLGSVPTEYEMFDADAPGAQVARRRDPIVPFGWNQLATADTIENLQAGVGQMLAYLRDPPGPLLYQGAALHEARYIDVHGGTPLPDLFRARDHGLIEILIHRYAIDFPIRLMRQPWLRGPELESSINKLLNPTLLIDQDTAGVPDGWTSLAGTHSILATDVAYQNSHTAAVDLLRQDVTASPAQVLTLSGEARRVSGSGTGRLRLSSVGGAATGDSADITTGDWGAFSVTVTMDALTTAARSILRQHTASGTTVLQFRMMQLELGTVPTLWVPGTQTLTLDPAVS